jgi:hypothetical protein
MILTSPTKQTHTDGARTRRGSGHGPGRAPGRRGVDWVRVEQLYGFVRARAQERLEEAARVDEDGLPAVSTVLRTLESMYALGRSSDAMASCAITYFRVRAMRDAHHPDFLGEWLGRPLTHAPAS